MVWREWSKHNQLVTVLTTKTPATSRPHSPHAVHIVPERLGIGVPGAVRTMSLPVNSNMEATAM